MSDTPQFSGDYIVGWKLRLIVRLEEFGNTTLVRNLATNPITPPQVMRGVTSTRSQATPQQVPATPSAPGGYVVSFAGGTVPSGGAGGGPQSVDSSQDGLTYTIGAVIPRSFKLGINGFKEPDTMSCELRYVDVPFDPMCFRSIGLELYVGTMTQDDYTAGVGGATRTTTVGTTQLSEPLNVIPDGFTGPQGEPRTNLRFQGFVDEWETAFTDEGLAVVRLKCSDNTRLFIDQPMPPGLRCSTTLPLDQAIAQLLANFPQFAGLTVSYLPAQATSPVIGTAFADGAQMPDGLQASNGGASQTLSVWDYLVELCTAIGHNVRVEGTNLIIQRIRAALGRNFPPRIGDPFVGRTWGGSLHQLRTFIWGRNCKTVTNRRKYSRTAVNCEVRSYNPLTKTTMLARFPPFANSQGVGGQASGPNASTNRLIHTLPGDGRQETKYTVFPVPGVTDQATLQNVAQAYYEGLNRGELGKVIHTRDLASFAGDATDPDILDLFAGDHIEFLTERFDDSNDTVDTDLGQLENALLQANLGYDLLMTAGFDAGFAAKYCATYAAVGFQTTFAVKRMDVSGDHEAGIDITIEGANCVEARVDGPGVADFADQALGALGTTPPTPQNQPVGGP